MVVPQGLLNVLALLVLVLVTYVALRQRNQRTDRRPLAGVRDKAGTKLRMVDVGDTVWIRRPIGCIKNILVAGQVYPAKIDKVHTAGAVDITIEGLDRDSREQQEISPDVLCSEEVVLKLGFDVAA